LRLAGTDGCPRERRAADFRESRNQCPETSTVGQGPLRPMQDRPGGHAGSLAIGYSLTEAKTVLTSAIALPYPPSAKLPSATPPAAVPVVLPVAPRVARQVASPAAPEIACPIAPPVVRPVALGAAWPIARPIAPPVAPPVTWTIAARVAREVALLVAARTASQIARRVARRIASRVALQAAPLIAAPVPGPQAVVRNCAALTLEFRLGPAGAGFADRGADSAGVSLAASRSARLTAAGPRPFQRLLWRSLSRSLCCPARVTTVPAS
jgi:hypothetical protein